jgi:hypothetical protein
MVQYCVVLLVAQADLISLGDPNDATCRTACVALANSVNNIALCQGNCVQGDGTEAANKKYLDCLQSCITAGTVVSTTVASNAGAVATGSGTATGTLSSLNTPTKY